MDERLMHRREFYIGGAWVAPAGTDRLNIVSPWSEQVVGSVPVATTADIDRAVDAARRAFEGPWSRTSPAERAAVILAVAAEFARRDDDLAGVEVEEMGLPITSARQQTAWMAPLFEFYADLATRYPFDRVYTKDAAAATVVKEPVGVVGAITPWNGPLTLSLWKLVPALAAGCTVVLKPPPESPLCLLVLAEVLHDAGVPAGVINIVPGGRDAGEHLVTHPGVDKIAFTGSTGAGKRIMSLCGDRIKRISLELGGKSAGIFLDDADLTTLLPTFVRAAMHNSGQVCAMHSRALVPRPLYDDAVELAAATAATLRIGDPHDADTVIGPLVARRQQERVLDYIDTATAEGAKVATGGKRPAGIDTGWFVEPTVLSGVDNGMRVAREEIFGPVLSFIPFDGDDEAVAIANDSDFGLDGGVWSADTGRAMAVARRLRTGSVYVNGGRTPYPQTPFGGYKQSGLGRELGVEGLESYLETKTIAHPPA
ncbi:aldehyde dehydrogenase [Nocardia nova]|uniref:aldehyde dehydrogenase n=1 Tax=Nocardia nova TaxID=37330 RepID=UPI0033F7CC57